MRDLRLVQSRRPLRAAAEPMRKLSFNAAGSGNFGSMSTVIWIVIVVLGIALIAGIALAAKRRNQAKVEAHRGEAAEARDLAKVSQLEADRHAAEAEERAARAKREQLTAEQHQLSAATHRSEAQDLQSRADEIDPDL